MSKCSKRNIYRCWIPPFNTPRPAIRPTTFTGPVSWGANASGQLGNGDNSIARVPTAVAESAALAGDKIVQMAGGEDHALGLGVSGRVYAWGDNTNGQLGNGSFGGEINVPEGPVQGAITGKRIVQVRAGRRYSLVLAEDGLAYSWGLNDMGQLGDGTFIDKAMPVAILGLASLTEVAAGRTHGLARQNTALFAWGSGSDGELGNGTNIMYTPTAVAVDQTGVLAGKTISRVSAGDRYSVVLDPIIGKAYTWGRNNRGQLGDLSNTERNVPVAVYDAGALAGRRLADLDAGYDHVVSHDIDDIFSWGAGTRGQLGNGLLMDSNQPVVGVKTAEMADKRILEVTAGRDFSAAVLDSGEVFAWGDDTLGQLGDDGAAAPFTPVPVAVDYDADLDIVALSNIDAGADAMYAIAEVAPPS